MSALLQLEALSTGLLQALDFALPSEQCTAILGASGSGKTTLLNAIAGNIAYRGCIKIQQRPMETVPAWQRPCRYLNQRLYLFPHLTIEQNLRLAQYAAKQSQERSQRIDLLEQMGVAHLAKRYPQHISGGEQQRVALARALISQPTLLLLDEPFSSVDWEIRKSLWQLLRNIQQRQRISILLVTHEPREVAALAQEVVYLEQGVLRFSA